MATEKNCRYDHQLILNLIPEGSSVMDLGCGDGELLSKLVEGKNVKGLGIEKDIDRVAETISRGVPVLHSDLDEGLAGIPDGSFDYVILQKTLQAVNKPLFVLDEMMRVGVCGIISFPNFGHWQVVSALLFTGKMPVTPNLPYQWHDTPNIHLFTALDFLDWAEVNGVKIEQGYSWSGNRVEHFNPEKSTLAEEVLFVISRFCCEKENLIDTGRNHEINQ